MGAAEAVGQDLAICQLTDAVGLAFDCVCGASVHYESWWAAAEVVGKQDLAVCQLTDAVSLGMRARVVIKPGFTQQQQSPEAPACQSQGVRYSRRLSIGAAHTIRTAAQITHTHLPPPPQVCHHLTATKRPGRPLIISAHGPPGVGKTLSHQLLARALYNQRPRDGLDCPGRDCRGYKVCVCCVL